MSAPGGAPVGRRSPPVEKISCSPQTALLRGYFIQSSFGVTDSRHGPNLNLPKRRRRFYAKQCYADLRDILPFIRDRSELGDLSGVLLAFDEFFSHYPTYHRAGEKAEILTGIVRNTKPERCVEIRTFPGYSAITRRPTLFRQKPVGKRSRAKAREVATEAWSGRDSRRRSRSWWARGKRVVDVKAMVGGSADHLRTTASPATSRSDS